MSRAVIGRLLGALAIIPVVAAGCVGGVEFAEAGDAIIDTGDGSDDTLEVDTLEQPLIGNIGADPNPLTFWWYSGDGQQLRPALECAITRIRNATCLPIDVSIDAHHWVRQKPEADMGGRLGWTTGSWGSTRIALKTVMGPNTNCRVLVHEIAQHVLQRRNDDGHVPPMFQLSEELIINICIKQAQYGIACGCVNPESDDNPIPATDYDWECTGVDQ